MNERILAGLWFCAIVAACGPSDGTDGASENEGGAEHATDGSDSWVAAFCARSCSYGNPSRCTGHRDGVCTNECTTLIARYPCQPEWEALGQCAAARPESDYYCSAAGDPELESSVCAAERDAVVACPKLPGAEAG